MLAQIETLVGGIDEDGVVGEALLFEGLAKAGEVFIDTLDGAEVVLGVALELPAHELDWPVAG